MITILSILLTVIGILFVILSIKEYDKNRMVKYNKIKLFIDLVTGFSYTIMGLLVVLKIISGRYLIWAVLILSILNSLTNYIIKLRSCKM